MLRGIAITLPGRRVHSSTDRNALIAITPESLIAAAWIN
jgi:hypothetical protein